MKTRSVLAIILTLALTLSLAACGAGGEAGAGTTTAAPQTTAAPVPTTTAAPAPIEHCLCGQTTHKPGCDGTVHTWTEWDTGYMLPSETGYFKLTCPVTTESQVQLADGTDLVIDLNGQTVTIAGVRAFSVHNRNNTSLTLTDTSADQSGKFVVPPTNTTQDSSKIWFASKDTESTCDKNTLNIIAGTYDGSKLGAKVNGQGGMITITGTGNVVNIYGGTIIGAPLLEGKNGASFNCSSNCFLNFYGGTVTGGSVQEGCFGGGVFLQGTGTLTLSGDVQITGNTPNNIGIKKGTLVLKDLGPNAKFDFISNEGEGISIPAEAEQYRAK